MGASNSIQSSTKIKRQKIDEGEQDRISCLPDHILHQILSHLPTKYAVATSVLSTRWKYLWTSISTLDFCQESFVPNYLMNISTFMSSVEQVLLQHEGNIQKFCLSTTMLLDDSRVNVWISTLLKRKVQELIIHFYTDDPFVLPSSLFTCESITILKLNVWSKLQLPSSILCFSNLKVLHLKNVRFYCDQPIQQVSISLPIVEELVLKDCEWVDIEAVNIYVPTLKRQIFICFTDNFVYP
ncbi:hypothetical protein AQUCO_04700116v1 [Aquilegia coerulea]|uniref:F-box domain-containing protein n=1 Tax=Aquilegia coerulea TaxID=218851 RepID=A0A2G5CL42_AQUCA|nr:hypothetical protein AQUCO_04700116v1 [Aquilegia coerulea]